MSNPRHVILVDGTCIACNRLVAFILRHDGRGVFGFAHIQSERAQAWLARHGEEPDIDTIYLVADADTDAERLLLDGAAGRVIWPLLFWFAWPVRLVPVVLLNLWYRSFARVRYRLFGQADACIVPTEAERARFLADARAEA